jgi:3-oxoacyl-[acyl-carrier-protein] synthase-3
VRLGRPVGGVGTGCCVPERRLTNADLERMVETSDEWIVQRTGIRERRIVAPGVASSDLGEVAARRALEAAGVDPGDVDLVVVATVTPDQAFPSTACHIQNRLGAKHAGAFDVSAACSGFLYGLMTGWQFVATGMYETVLVVGVDCMSTITDYRDRNTCVLFGDAAGAVVLRPEPRQGELVYGFLRGDGSGSEFMNIPAGGSRRPPSHETVEQGLHYMTLKGNAVFKFAVDKMRELIEDALERNGWSAGDVGLVIPHQVNTRIIEAAVRKLDIPMDRVYVNIDRYGNTAAASIPLALDEAVREERMVKGKLAVMVAFGAGLTWASAVLRW